MGPRDLFIPCFLHPQNIRLLIAVAGLSTKQSTLVVYPPTGSKATRGRWAPHLRPGGAWSTLPFLVDHTNYNNTIFIHFVYPSRLLAQQVGRRMYYRNCTAVNEVTSAGRASGQPADAALGGRHGRHLESMASYQKSDSANRCVFSWRTILLNFIPIPFISRRKVLPPG